LLSFVVAVLVPLSATGQPQTNKDRIDFFLPKNPVAAAYVLGRLSNQELVQVPRSEFVYVALLQRAGLEKKYRTEALEGLAQLRKTDSLTELLAGLAELDKKGDESNSVLRDLGSILLEFKPKELAAKRAPLEKLAGESQQPLARQLGIAGIITADESVER